MMSVTEKFGGALADHMKVIWFVPRSLAGANRRRTAPAHRAPRVGGVTRGCAARRAAHVRPSTRGALRAHAGCTAWATPRARASNRHTGPHARHLPPRPTAPRLCVARCRYNWMCVLLWVVCFAISAFAGASRRA